MHFTTLLLVSAFVVSCCVSWSNCQSANSSEINQSGKSTNDVVTTLHPITTISHETSTLSVHQPVTLQITKQHDNGTRNVNEDALYDSNITSSGGGDITESSQSTQEEAFAIGVKDDSSNTESFLGISIEPTISPVEEKSIQIDDETPTEEYLEYFDTDFPLTETTDSYSTESNEPLRESSFTEYSSYDLETNSYDQSHPTTEETTESLNLIRSSQENRSNTILESDQSEGVTILGHRTEKYSREDTTTMPIKIHTDSYELSRFTTPSDDTTEIPTTAITSDQTLKPNVVDKLQLQSKEDILVHKLKPTDNNWSKEVNQRKKQDNHWNTLTESNQIFENDFEKSSLKKRWKDRIGKKRIFDDLGFVVSHPEEERLDEEDDLKIFESVVKSMAQWELKKLQKKMNSRKRVKRDEEMVCYKDLGCFRDEGPFDYLDMLPSPPEEINTRFLLFTRERPDREKLIRYQNVSAILDTSFNSSRPTKMLIHGFGSSCYSAWIREMREALLMMMDVNIICVNWQKGAEVPNYVRAASNTRLVGRQVAVLIEKMNAFLNTTFDDFHLIGFSLGAHVSGYAGARLKNLSRISGLDPAGPLFESYSPTVRLDETDAKFVDVIHTNAETLFMGGLGAFEPMGHVDFYPNGGRMQKGCNNIFVGGVSDILWPTEGDGRYLCNHRRGYKYYLNSVAPICKFPSFICRDYETFLTGNCFPCESCGNMGYFADQAQGRGQLYLVTRDTEPFCANQYKVVVKHSGGPPADLVTTYGRIDVTFIASDGLNETLQLTQKDDMAMEAGSETIKILVPHPALFDVVSVQLRYTAYQGWISSGYARWAIDKISLMDSHGKMLSFCNRGTTLVTGQAMQFNLLPGECSVTEVAPIIHPSNNLQPFLDTLPEESENDVLQAPSLQIGVAPHLEPHLNITHASNKPINITQPIPAPLLTPVNAHASVLTSLQGQAPLSITLELPQQQYQEIPPGVYEPGVRQRVPPLQSAGHMPPNIPPQLNYESESIRVATTSPTSYLEINQSDFAISSEEPVNVIPAPNLGVAPKPFPASHVYLPSQTFRPDAMRVPEQIPYNPYIDTPHSDFDNNQNPFNSNSYVFNPNLSTLDYDSLNPGGKGNSNSSPHNTHFEVLNSTTVRVTTHDQNVMENIFDSTFSPRTSDLLQGARTPEYSNTTPLLPSVNYHLSVSPKPVDTFTINSSSKPLQLGATHKNLYSSNDNRDDLSSIVIRKNNDFVNHLRPPPPSVRPYPSQSGLNNVPSIINSNSLIDGKILEKDRSRSLTLGPIPSNSFNTEIVTNVKHRSNCSNGSLCSPQRNFSIGENTSDIENSPKFPVLPPYFPSNTQSADSFQPPLNIRQGNHQRRFPSRADAPPRHHTSYGSTFVDGSRINLPFQSSRKSDIATVHSQHGSINDEPHIKNPNSDSLPFAISSYGNSKSEEYPSENKSSMKNNPSLPNINPTPLETIVGYGRAPQPAPIRYSSDALAQDSAQVQHYREVEHKHKQESFIEIQPQTFQQKTQIYFTESQQQNQQQESSSKNSPHSSVSVSIGNVTRMNIDGESSHLSPSSSPFYVQILPPTFSQLPHLETYSIPRNAMKEVDNSSDRKRGRIAGRAQRGRSLPGSTDSPTMSRLHGSRSLPASSVPPPSGRGAIFKPLLLQLQDNRQGRYIPLRSITPTRRP